MKRIITTVAAVAALIVSSFGQVRAGYIYQEQGNVTDNSHDSIATAQGTLPLSGQPPLCQESRGRFLLVIWQIFMRLK